MKLSQKRNFQKFSTLHKLTHLARFERRKRMQQKRIDRLLKEKEILKENENKTTEEENEIEETPTSIPPAAPVPQARGHFYLKLKLRI